MAHFVEIKSSNPKLPTFINIDLIIAISVDKLQDSEQFIVDYISPDPNGAITSEHETLEQAVEEANRVRKGKPSQGY